MKISFGHRLLWFLVFFVTTAIGRADPENFMVDGFTFVRPVPWKWVSQDKLAEKGLLLKIPGSNTNDMASVYFRAFSGDEGTAEKRIKPWRQSYKSSPESVKVRFETKTISLFKIVSVEMEGKSTLVSSEPFSVYAAIIQTKKGSLVVRMSGRKKLIDTSKPTFNEMVEQALKDRESD